jgi:hypothetical protein
LRQRDRYFFRGVSVVLATSQDRSALLRRTKSTAELQFVSDFGLDNGMPYLQSAAKIAVLIADQSGEQFEENSKAVVAAAFAGIAIAPGADPNVVANFIEKIPSLRRSIEDESFWESNED